MSVQKQKRSKRAAYNKTITVRDNPWTTLAHAIVQRAAVDFVDAYREQDEIKMSSIIKFFRSPWYDLLCSIDGNYFIQKLITFAQSGKKVNRISTSVLVEGQQNEFYDY